MHFIPIHPQFIKLLSKNNEYDGELGITIENSIRILMDKSEYTGKSAFTQNSVIVFICGC